MDPTKHEDESISITGHTMINGWIRALLASVGGMLVAKGILDAHMEDTLIQILVPALSGIATVIATGIWSSAEKRLVKLLPPTVPVPGVANPPTG